MPSVSSQALDSVDDNAFRVLLTGFGPFAHFKENPSWLAVKRLHNTILSAESPSNPIVVDDQVILSETNGAPPRQHIHITTVQIPVTYEAVLATVPGLHAHPPVLPSSEDAQLPTLPPPENGYDLVFHIGVAGRGPLRMERLGHKHGYNMKDASGSLAPLAPVTPPAAHKDGSAARGIMDSEADLRERERLARANNIPPVVDPTPNEIADPPTRGFGKGYETLPEELHTDIDVEKVVQHLKDVGHEQIYSSMDAGHYLCDFIYYASLAETRRTPGKGKTSKVLFLHCPPVNQPLSTEEVTEAIKEVIVWICGQE